MSVRPWQIHSWPRCEWNLSLDPSEWPTFLHVGTHIDDETDLHGRTSGETVWIAATMDGKSLAAGWEWTELSAGVIALRDPNTIVSNGASEGIDRPLTRLTHTLAWRPMVAHVLALFRVAGQPPVGVGVSSRRRVLRGSVHASR